MYLNVDAQFRKQGETFGSMQREVSALGKDTCNDLSPSSTDPNQTKNQTIQYVSAKAHQCKYECKETRQKPVSSKCECEADAYPESEA
jgi:hypothetical protein